MQISTSPAAERAGRPGCALQQLQRAPAGHSLLLSCPDLGSSRTGWRAPGRPPRALAGCSSWRQLTAAPTVSTAPGAGLVWADRLIRSASASQ